MNVFLWCGWKMFLPNHLVCTPHKGSRETGNVVHIESCHTFRPWSAVLAGNDPFLIPFWQKNIAQNRKRFITQQKHMIAKTYDMAEDKN